MKKLIETGARSGLVRERYCSNCGEELEWERADYYCFDCRSEYNRQWKQANADYYKEYCKSYNKQYREEHKEELAEYNRNWWEQQTQRQYIYFLDAIVKYLYIGGTKDPYRPKSHLQGNTHLVKRVKDVADWIELGVASIQYIDVTDVLQGDEEQREAERDYIERLFIQLHNPELNGEPPNPVLSAERMEELEHIVYNELVDFNQLDIKKITTPVGVATFNFKDLKLV